MNAIEIFGQFGVLTIDPADGLVTDYEPSAEGDDYKNISRFNMSEWQQHYSASPCGRHDIRDFGYWDEWGRYVPPAADWRKLQVEMQHDNEAMSDLFGPRGRVI